MPNRGNERTVLLAAILLIALILGAVAVMVPLFDCPVCRPHGTPELPPGKKLDPYREVFSDYHSLALECARCGNRGSVTLFRRLP